MSDINKNWARWIFASISKHIDDRKGTLDLYIEGQYRQNRVKKDNIELRMDGPYITEINKNYFDVYVEINILVSSYMDNTNYHRIHEDVGIVANILSSPVGLYKYGNSLVDTGEQFGCLTLIQDTQSRDRVQINHFGIINPQDNLMQASVEAHYKIFLEGE